MKQSCFALATFVAITALPMRAALARYEARESGHTYSIKVNLIHVDGWFALFTPDFYVPRFTKRDLLVTNVRVKLTLDSFPVIPGVPTAFSTILQHGATSDDGMLSLLNTYLPSTVTNIKQTTEIRTVRPPTPRELREAEERRKTIRIPKRAADHFEQAAALKKARKPH